ncbi:hypothetical protein K3495_g9268 [Podosphaera aphanis]|nr:hypothetical protein K3495_g9268 [Podosphaera aphanis]
MQDNLPWEGVSGADQENGGCATEAGGGRERRHEREGGAGGTTRTRGSARRHVPRRCKRRPNTSPRPGHAEEGKRDPHCEKGGGKRDQAHAEPPTPSQGNGA